MGEKDYFDKKSVNNVESEGNFTSNSQDNKKGKNLLSRIKKIIILLSIIVAISIAIPVFIQIHRKNLYNKLISEMQYFDFDSVQEIDSILNQLPDDYKDVDKIRSQYKLIKKHATTLSESQSLTSSNFKEGSSDKIREAYAKLTLISPLYFDWNLEDFLDSIKIEVLIFDIEWEYSSLYYFKWSYNENLQDERLSTDIPNNKESGKEYYYTTDITDDSIIFGYENKNDSTEQLNAFKVSNIRYKNETYYIDVYCFKNDTRYIFTINE